MNTIPPHVPPEQSNVPSIPASPAQQTPTRTTYANSFAKYGFWVAIPAMLAFPHCGVIFGAIVGAVCGGGGSALAGAIGAFIDALNEKPDTSSPPIVDKKGFAILSLIIGIVGLVAWFIPIIGLPITIAGYVFGYKARSSSLRNIALTGMGLCLVGMLLSAVNAYFGALMGVRAGMASQP